MHNDLKYDINTGEVYLNGKQLQWVISIDIHIEADSAKSHVAIEFDSSVDILSIPEELLKIGFVHGKPIME